MQNKKNKGQVFKNAKITIVFELYILQEYLLVILAIQREK